MSNSLKLVVNSAWVQCDNEHCQKWRRISKDIASKISTETPWVCSMNLDSKHNTCESPEETENDAEVSMLRRYRMRYVATTIKPGSIVLAKLSGFCRWPAIITKDPIEDGRSAFEDTSGEAFSYHVEFFGESHSHSWIPAHSVTSFNPETYKLSDETGQKNKFQKASTGIVHTNSVYLTGFFIEERSKGVAYALEEAKEWQKSSFAERLERIHFKYEDSQLKDPRWLRNEQEFNKQINGSAFLLNHSKEQKYQLDLQRYTSNRQSFMEDLEQFHAKRGLQLRVPVWQNILVNLYDLFLAVYDRGGYYKVCQNRAWRVIYREVTGVPQCSSCFAQTPKSLARSILPLNPGLSLNLCREADTSLAYENHSSAGGGVQEVPEAPILNYAISENGSEFHLLQELNQLETELTLF
ncbi:hypothetical protein CAPTEDRAFT_198746 [Capitella teleta]|uniref:CW-type domain-containing protein n=1 Tax=Capitella teleta TaxID=283909 RepID=R7V263_CAPTE|nr:hypothetical protein CAPTEDRAFT_198746 [Capitella teleta]|eukprot:ELU12943.1 hypothetical protein CAPTEDRAFT_198746 [Capitella teleta]